MSIPRDFKAIKLKLASPEEILAWSNGEIKKPETINYRTQKPEQDGLFSERIFGPTKDWECYCGKYKKIRYKGVICDKCGVEITRAIVRRERMGHIKLAAPVTHIWFLRGVPSRVGLMLDLSIHDLERITYFTGYLIISVDDNAKGIVREELEAEYKSKKKLIESKYSRINIEASKKQGKDKKNIVSDQVVKNSRDKEKELNELTKSFQAAKEELSSIKRMVVISELKFRELSLKYGHVFQASIGAEAIRRVLKEIDLEKMAEQLEAEAEQSSSAVRKKVRARLRLVKSMIKSGIRPESMIMTVLPVLPPDLRPMVQLDGGRYATSDLNDLYRRVINRNNRLKRLAEINAPEVICRNEKRMLQEAVDSLVDNSARHGSQVQTQKQKRPLKSLADMLKGKEGRFRQNLLGKRVDYSGRSVIVIGPELKLHQCGIPKIMALELFKPFVIRELIKRGLAHNVRIAGKFIEDKNPEIWDILDEVTTGQCVLLNRAPTLHRLSIQAFHPVLVEGKAIRIHPMVCSAFNADFDGDQMAVHLPLTPAAQKEANSAMISTQNLLKPATGHPIITPTQDIVLGCYYITTIKPGAKGEKKCFANPDEAIFAFENRHIDIRAKIKVRLEDGKILETCAGRILFNRVLPDGFGFINKTLKKKDLSKLVAEILGKYGRERTVKLVDDMKSMGFAYLTRAGLSWGIDDLEVPQEKHALIEEAVGQVEKIRHQYREGFLTDFERYVKVVEAWVNTKDKIADLTSKTLDKTGSAYSMVDSGARGSWSQIVQMTGMRGLMANPSGKTIELPVKNSFKEGLSVLEYFISTHGSRKGLTDTALRTASAGYLTRRLVDVAQDITITAEDCGDKVGSIITRHDAKERGKELKECLFGRCAAEDIKNKKGKIIVKAGEVIDGVKAKMIDEEKIDEARIRSIISCKMERGICQKCYGWDLAYNEIVRMGTAVGIIAAQSIGEPGTQLTLRTFHTGGIAGDGDITQGLSRVEEILEIRGIQQPALIAELDGKIHITEEKDKKVVRIIAQKITHDKFRIEKGVKVKVEDGQKVETDDVLLINKYGEKVKAIMAGKIKCDKEFVMLVREGVEEKEYNLPKNTVMWVNHGDLIARGQQLSEGSVDIQQLFRISGPRAVEKYILKDVQFIYSSQGQDLNDKHLEVIVRQMVNWVRIREAGDSDFLSGDIVHRVKYNKACKELLAAKKTPPDAMDLLLGITKASFATESFLSAASFQETARVLIEAAITGKVDKLYGLKENVIIGRLIPAGTGFRK